MTPAQSEALDVAADAAMAAWGAFRRAHWAYFDMRDRPHPLTGVVAPRQPAIDAEGARLCEAARQANHAAETAAAELRRLDRLAMQRSRAHVAVRGPSKAQQWRARTSQGYDHDHERY